MTETILEPLFADTVSINEISAEVYLDTKRSSDQLYHEQHDDVAVMFASIPEFMEHYSNIELGCLEVLNSIVVAFDAVSIHLEFI